MKRLLLLILSIALAGPAAAAEDRFDQRLYRNGMSLLRAGKANHALAAFDELVRDYPTSGVADNALFQSGAFHYPVPGVGELHRADPAAIRRALPFFQRIRDDYPRSDMAAPALLKLALATLEARNPRRSLDEGFALFSRLLNLYPDSPVVDRALLGTAWVQVELGQCGGALNHLDRLFERHPDSAAVSDGLFLAAGCLAEGERWVPAMETLQRLGDREGESLEAMRAKQFLTLIYRTRFLPDLGRPLAYEPDAGFEAAAATAGARSCTDLAVDAEERLYVSDTRQSVLWSFREAGELAGRSDRPGGIRWIGVRGERGILTGGRDTIHLRAGPRPVERPGKGVDEIAAAAITAEGAIFLLDRRARSVLLYDQGLAFRDALDVPAEGRPIRIRLGRRDDLWLLSDAPSELIRRAPAGGWTAVPLGEEFDAARPVDFDLDRLGNLYLLARRGGPVLMYDPAGRPIGRLQPAAGADGRRWAPERIAVGPSGSIYLCDRKGDRIVRYR